MNNAVPDRIEKSIDIHASRSQVWNAVVDAQAFEAWFGMRLDGPFVAGATRRVTVVGTRMDPAVADAQRAHAGLTFEILVEAVEPEQRLAFRWHPGAVDPSIDVSAEPTTLVEFVLDDIPTGTRVRVIESGFSAIPEVRRAQAFHGNEQGWTVVVGLLDAFIRHGA